MSKKEYPVVCRFAGMKPRDLGGYEAHRYRKGGDVGHVNRRRSHLNRRLIGPADWARQAMAEIRTMAMEAYTAELETLQKRGDRKRLALRLAEGPKDPWRASRHGPLREVILTVNKEWFEQTDDPNALFSTKNEQDFEDRAVAWLQQNFGDDVIHARADLDEEAYHIHAVIMPRATVNKYGVECRVLQPSIHPLIKDYEEAQDSVGRWFAPLGLVRGERRKQAIRDALNDGRTPPPKRRHVRPADWRRNEERRLAQKEAEIERRKRSVDAKDREARDTLAYAEAVGAGRVDVGPADASVSPKPAPEASLAIASETKFSAGFFRARNAFRAALMRMRIRAEAEAKALAERSLAAERKEIEAADDVIVEITAMLPQGLRARVAGVRRKLSAKIIGFERGVRASDGRQAPRGIGDDGKRFE